MGSGKRTNSSRSFALHKADFQCIIMAKGFGVGITHLLHKPRDCHSFGGFSYVAP